VGIGTNLPVHRLHVGGDAIISGYLYDSTNSTGTDGYVFTTKENGPRWEAIEDVLSGVGGNGTANYVPKWIDSDTLGDSVMAESGGNVGIGTIAPAAQLEVYSTTANSNGIAYIRQAVATNNPTLLVEQTTSGGNANVDQGLVVKAVGTSDGSGNTLHVYQRDGSTTGLVVKGSGNVGIGTTAPSPWKLYVNGITKINGALECAALSPIADNLYALGNTSRRWSSVTAVALTANSGTFNTSGSQNGLLIDSSSTTHNTIASYGRYGMYHSCDVSNGYGLYIARNLNEAGASALAHFVDSHATNTQTTVYINHVGSSGYGLDCVGAGRFSGALTAGSATIAKSTGVPTDFRTANNLLTLQGNGDVDNIASLKFGWGTGTPDSFLIQAVGVANNNGYFRIARQDSGSAGITQLLKIDNAGAATFSGSVICESSLTVDSTLTGTTASFDGNISSISAKFGNTSDGVHLGQETGYGIVQGTDTTGGAFNGLRLRTQGYAITIPNAAAPDVTIENDLITHHVYPLSDNAYELGNTSLRWSSLTAVAVTGVTGTFSGASTMDTLGVNTSSVGSYKLYVTGNTKCAGFMIATNVQSTGDAFFDTNLRLKASADPTGASFEGRLYAYNNTGAMLYYRDGYNTAHALHSASDYRLKENITDYSGSDACTLVKGVNAKRFDYIEDAAPADQRTNRVGFMANELQDAGCDFGGMVSGVKDETMDDGEGNQIPRMQSVDYKAMVPILWSALQEALKRIEALEEGNN